MVLYAATSFGWGIVKSVSSLASSAGGILWCVLWLWVLPRPTATSHILADTLSHLVDLDPDARLYPENAGWEFGYYIFEPLPKLSSEDIVQVCEILSGENVIRPDPDVQQPFVQQLRSPLTLDLLHALQGQDDKCTTLMRMLKNGKLDPVAYSLQEGILD